MKKICMLLVIVALVCPNVFSATKTVVRETKGQGASRDDAIKDALAQAVAQVKGVLVSSEDYDFGFRSASADIEQKDSGKKVEFDAVSIEASGSALRTDIEGLVKTYEMLEEKKLDDASYEVKLKVWVYDYEAPESSKRFKLALMPIKTVWEKYDFGDFNATERYLSHKLSQKLSNRLTGTNKFAVLDREYVEEFIANKKVLIHNASLEEKAKFGKALGADYMVVGTITDAGLEIIEKKQTLIGRPIRWYKLDFIFDYRVIVCPTRQIKLSDTVVISLRNDEVKELVEYWGPGELDYREMVENLLTKVADKVVDKIIDRMYPVRIASINNQGRIIINQGGKRIVKGSVLNVFSEGEEIIDADTKESLGKTEVLVATIKIDKVTPKISYARVVKGDLSKITKGLVCRGKEIKAKTKKGLKSDIERTSSGGVKLPFE